MRGFSRHDILLSVGILMLAGIFLAIRYAALAGNVACVITLFYPFLGITFVLSCAIVFYGYDSYESDKTQFPF